MKYPTEIGDIFSFEGYLFKDGKFILNDFKTESTSYYRHLHKADNYAHADGGGAHH